MWLFSTPHRRAIWIAWGLLAAFTLPMVIALGPDWWMPVVWPFAFVCYLTYIIVRWERRIFRKLLEDEAAEQAGPQAPANLSRPPKP